MAVTPLQANTVVNVQMFGNLCGQTIINNFPLQATTAPNPVLDYTDYLGALRDQLAVPGILNDLYLACLPLNYTLDFTRIQPIYPQRYRFIDATYGSPGTYAHNAQTANQSVAIERYGNINGKHGIGGVRIPLSGPGYSGGLVTDIGLLNALDALALTITQVITTALPLMIWAPVIYNPASSIPVITPVVGANHKSTARVMRRRTVGLGI